MKAKHYFAKFLECKTNEELEQEFLVCIQDLIKDTDKLIDQRCAKRREAIASIIKEVNQKYLAIVRMQKEWKEKLPPFEFSDHPLANITFTDDGFQACYVHERPQYSWAFDLDKNKKFIEEKNKAEERRAEFVKNFTPSPVIPLREITQENLMKEILSNIYHLGVYFNEFKMPIEMIKPLARRIALLRYWAAKGINYDDIAEFEADEDAWVMTHQYAI